MAAIFRICSIAIVPTSLENVYRQADIADPKALGLDVPPSLIARADEVIE
jgi:hypothetical protein